MKKLRILTAILIVMVLALSAIMPTISFAADEEETETYTIIVTGDVAGRTLETLKLFDLELLDTGTKDDDGNTVYQYVYTWASTSVQTYFASLQDSEGNYLTTIELAVEYLSNLSNTELIKFANNYYLANYNSATETVVASDAKSVDITVDGLGYYLIYDATASVGDGHETSVTMLSNVIVSGNTTIELKANVVEVEKEANKTSANVGDTVTFTVTSAVPDTTEYDSYSFVVTDTMSNGLDYVINSVKVTIDGTEVTSYTASYNESTRTLTITFDTTSWDSMTDQEIVITYDATLNSAAAIENSNSVKITYSNDPTSDGKGTTTTEEVKVYSYTINLTKKNVKGTPLEGAVFVLQNSEGKYYSYSNGKTSWVDSIDGATTFTTNASGTVSITGIAAGIYTLVETVAPEGYYLPKSGFEFTITDDTTETTTVATLRESSDYLEATTTTVNAGSSTLSLAMTVLNSTTESLLPTTGGIGTKIFTAVGILVMAGAGVALVVRNRKGERA